MTTPSGLVALLMARGLREDEARLLVAQWNVAIHDANGRSVVRSASARRFVATILSLAFREGLDVEDAAHRFEERAAIREFDGGQSREDAERGASDELDGGRP